MPRQSCAQSRQSCGGSNKSHTNDQQSEHATHTLGGIRGVKYGTEGARRAERGNESGSSMRAAR
eukprot:CAMPEP_0119363748 /NCGR_PEP_ID=MMETSP1334-20130426/10680_1 /TAXON_ID=127549 /ORGANISM="Calcidiscus leptoporus, Strain RCC1130" /LENGTH=63 /DNA_ID=CAMNT_0007379279 /DNA_START=100 /DNA_END=288 /DNA_ORIENTATION=+